MMKVQTTIKRTHDVRRGAGVWIATLGSIGNIPRAPGAAGSLVGVGFVALFNLIPFASPWRAVFLCLAMGIFFAIGVWAGDQAEKYLGRPDPGQVVFDEFVGQICVFIAEPTGAWKLLLAGFLAFRIFDVWKPFPARRAERLPGGWGIMMDDIVAGVYALAVVVALSHILR